MVDKELDSCCALQMIDFLCRDAILVTLLNCGTSVFAGFVVFGIIGFMAEQLSLDVKDVAVKGEGIE